MSQENVEIMKRLFAETERGNFWIPQFFDPRVRIKWLEAVGTASETVGLQAMTDFMTNWLDVHENMALIAERIVDAGENDVVVIGKWRGRGKASGIVTEMPWAGVWTLRAGRVTNIDSYKAEAEAFDAVGLSE